MYYTIEAKPQARPSTFWLKFGRDQITFLNNRLILLFFQSQYSFLSLFNTEYHSCHIYSFFSIRFSTPITIILPRENKTENSENLQNPKTNDTTIGHPFYFFFNLVRIKQKEDLCCREGVLPMIHCCYLTKRCRRGSIYFLSWVGCGLDMEVIG